MERKKFEGETEEAALEKAAEYFECSVEELAFEKSAGMLSFLGKSQGKPAIKAWIKAEEENEEPEEELPVSDDDQYAQRESYRRETDYKPRDSYHDRSSNYDSRRSSDSYGRDRDYASARSSDFVEEEETNPQTDKIKVKASDLDGAIKKAARTLGCEISAVEHRKLPSLAWLGQSGNVVQISAWCSEENAGTVDYPDNEPEEETKADEPAEEKESEQKSTDDDDDFASDPRLADLGPIGIKAFKYARAIASSLCPGAEMEISENDDEISINFSGDEAEILLSEEADPLDALQYLVARLLSTDSETHKRIRVNVDDYRQTRANELIEVAHSLAKQAIEEAHEVATEPLNAQERRLVHMALADVSGIETESRGDEQRKRVYVIPE
jgi:spoIIIJ-associated protein